jgi:gamma-glutamyl hydrolase
MPVVIGIMTVPLSKYTRLKVNRRTYFDSYIANSYVKWLEQSGAQVVPIPFNWSRAKIKKTLKQVNGVLFPGGDIDRDTKLDFRRYVKCYKQIFEYAIAENDNGNFFPLWGTCLGFEFLCMMPYDPETILANYHDNLDFIILDKVASRDQNLHFNLYKNSKIPIPNWRVLAKGVKLHFNHSYGFLLNKKTLNVVSNYLNIISTNKDKNNKRFISTIKFKKYPFWGTQWHPEKSAYEFSKPSVLHDMKSIVFGRVWSDFFIKECEKNTNTLIDKKLLIYYKTLHNPHKLKNFTRKNRVIPLRKSAFMQSYYF